MIFYLTTYFELITECVQHLLHAIWDTRIGRNYKKKVFSHNTFYKISKTLIFLGDFTTRILIRHGNRILNSFMLRKSREVFLK